MVIVVADLEVGEPLEHLADQYRVMAAGDPAVGVQSGGHALELVRRGLVAGLAPVGLAKEAGLHRLGAQVVDGFEGSQRSPAAAQRQGIARAAVLPGECGQVKAGVGRRILPCPPDMHGRQTQLGLGFSMQVAVPVGPGVVFGGRQLIVGGPHKHGDQPVNLKGLFLQEGLDAQRLPLQLLRGHGEAFPRGALQRASSR